jgi:hypothetical protein
VGLHGGDAGQLLAEVVGEAGAVLGRMEEPVEVVEENFWGQVNYLEIFGDRLII